MFLYFIFVSFMFLFWCLFLFLSFYLPFLFPFSFPFLYSQFTFCLFSPDQAHVTGYLISKTGATAVVPATATAATPVTSEGKWEENRNCQKYTYVSFFFLFFFLFHFNFFPYLLPSYLLTFSLPLSFIFLASVFGTTTADTPATRVEGMAQFTNLSTSSVEQ